MKTSKGKNNTLHLWGCCKGRWHDLVAAAHGLLPQDQPSQHNESCTHSLPWCGG